MMTTPVPPVQVIIPKRMDQKLGFDTLGFNYLNRHRSLRLNKQWILLSTVAWSLNCDSKSLLHLLITARRTILYGLQEKVGETEAIIAECKHMSDSHVEAVRERCIRPLEAKLEQLNSAMKELSQLRGACDRGANALVSRKLFLAHILPCAQRTFTTRVYSAWVEEVAFFTCSFPA